MLQTGNFRELTNNEINNVSGGFGAFCIQGEAMDRLFNFFQGQGLISDEQVVNNIAHSADRLIDFEDGTAAVIADNGRVYFFEDTDRNGLYDQIKYYDNGEQFRSTDGETWKKYLYDNGFVTQNNIGSF